MARADLRLRAARRCDSPVLITAFRGWNDGGQARDAGGRLPREQWDASGSRTIDSEGFYDFQAVAPER